MLMKKLLSTAIYLFIIISIIAFPSVNVFANWTPDSHYVQNINEGGDQNRKIFKLPQPIKWEVDAPWPLGNITLLSIDTDGGWDVGYKYAFDWNLGEGIDVGSDGWSYPELMTRADINIGANAWLKLTSPSLSINIWKCKPVNIDLLKLLTGVDLNFDENIAVPAGGPLQFTMPFLADGNPLVELPFKTGIYDGDYSKTTTVNTLSFIRDVTGLPLEYIGKADIGVARGLHGNLKFGLDSIDYFQNDANKIGSQKSAQHGVDLRGLRTAKPTPLPVNRRDYVFKVEPTIGAGVALFAELSIGVLNLAPYSIKEYYPEEGLEPPDVIHGEITTGFNLPPVTFRKNTTYTIPAPHGTEIAKNGPGGLPLNTMVPSKPALYDPANGVRPDNVVFTWSPSSCDGCGNVTYSLELRDVNRNLIFGSERDTGQFIGQTTYALPGSISLKPDATYFWKVIPRSQSGFSNPQAVDEKSFTTASTTPPPSSNHPPVAAFVYSPQPAYVPVTLQVNGSASTDPDGDSLEYSWSWGDGSPMTAWSSSPSASHLYSTANIYVVTLYVRDSHGLPSAAAKSVSITSAQVTNQSPTVAITGQPGVLNTDNTPTFQFRGTDADGSVSGYYCVVDHPELISGSLPDARYYTQNSSYTAAALSPGNHTLYVRAKDNLGGLSGLISTTFSVEAPLYDASSAIIYRIVPSPVSLKPGQTTQFTISFQNKSNVSWRTDLTNDNYIELRSVSHDGSTPADSYLYPGNGLWIDNDRRRVVVQNAANVAGAPDYENAWFIFKGKVPESAAPGPNPVNVYFRLYSPKYGYFGEIAQLQIVVAGAAPIPIQDDIEPVIALDMPYTGEAIPVNMPKYMHFSANDNVAVDHIDVSYSLDGGIQFTAVPGCTNLSGTSQLCIWTPTQTSSTVAIKAEAYDTSGNMAKSTVSCRIAAAACTDMPFVPELYDPGIYAEQSHLTISWQKIGNANQYILRESSSLDFSGASEYPYFGADNRIATLTDKANGTYFYQVKARNACGDSPWSNTADIEVRVNGAPNAPSNPTPANGTSGVSRTSTLRWNGGDSDGTADYYLEIGTSASNMTPRQGYGSANAYNTSFVVPFLMEPATTYYWRVKSKDDQGLVTEGPIWSFTTAYEYADIVITDFTVNGAIKNDSIVTVSVTVKNQGNYAAPGAIVKFYYSPIQDGENNEFIHDTISFNALEPGQSTTIMKQLTLDNMVAGTSYLVAKAVTAGYFTESSFTNNNFSYTINYTDHTGPDISYFDFRWSGNGTFKTNQNVQFVYEVTDDIGVSAIDLYYSTDNGTTWNVVAANLPVTNGGYGNFYNWTIPANTPLNSAFKVKIVARDTTGNSSLSVLGPLTISDGSNPTATITSPVAGDVWSLGATQDIKWTASSPNGITQVKIYYYHGNADYIATINSNPGIYSWSIANVPGYATTNGRIKIRVIDGNGNESEAWSSYFWFIRLKRTSSYEEP